MLAVGAKRLFSITIIFSLILAPVFPSVPCIFGHFAFWLVFLRKLSPEFLSSSMCPIHTQGGSSFTSGRSIQSHREYVRLLTNIPASRTGMSGYGPSICAAGASWNGVSFTQVCLCSG